MIVRTMAWLQQWRGVGWFQRSRTGGFPVPDAWQGWVATGMSIFALAGCAAVQKDVRAPLVLVTLAIYAAIMYWTYADD